MRYLIKARLRPEKRDALYEAVANETLGTGSVAFGEYVKNMRQARVLDDATVCWIEVCFCQSPLNEELPYWQEYFEDIRIEGAQDPALCSDANGDEARACFGCTCTQELEDEMRSWGGPFIE